MRHKFWLIVFLLLTCSIIADGKEKQTANQIFPELSRKQMQQDYDQLTYLIDNAFAAAPLIQLRTGTSMKDELLQLRKEIKKVKNSEEFSLLVRKALSILNDAHAAIADKNTITLYTTRFASLAAFGYISINDTLLANQYYGLMNEQFSQVKCGLRVKYLDGRYYNVRPFKYEDKLIQEGAEIRTINGQNINAFIANHKYDLYPILQWDKRHKKWYSEFLPLAMPLLNEKEMTLQVNGTEVKLNIDTPLEVLAKEHAVSDMSPLATVIDKHILYVRIPFMNSPTYYINGIDNLYTPEIDKIVLDIRGNRGGQDKVWQDILSHIIAEPFTAETRICIPDNDLLKQAMSTLFKFNKFPASTQTLLKEKYLDLHYQVDTIFPAENGIRFNKQIFIVQDEKTYSAASSLSSVAAQKENIILIGKSLTNIGGKGMTPLIFKLNNSGIVFRLPFTLDFSDARQIDDLYKDQVEVEINETIEQYLERILHYNSYDTDYLSEKDANIKYIKQQK